MYKPFEPMGVQAYFWVFTGRSPSPVPVTVLTRYQYYLNMAGIRHDLGGYVMRVSYRIWAVVVDVPVIDTVLAEYGLRLLFCLPVSKNLDVDYCEYLVLFTAPSALVDGTDSVYRLLHDMHMRNGQGMAHVLNVSCVAEYFDLADGAES